ncbi:MAG: unnamed protein product [uncultured Paraburkholderia sp.]|nr:MAG: unnamed protein product [uncultured Paraburkholderia sp.]
MRLLKHADFIGVNYPGRSNGNIAQSPRSVDEMALHAVAAIDDRSADVSDHITGHHIPGMLLAEASRQMMIAVVERFYLPVRRRAAIRFITHTMSLEYHEFTMPLPVDILFLPVRLRRASDLNLNLACEIRLKQRHRIGAVARFDISVIDQRYLDSRENAHLAAALDELST